MSKPKHTPGPWKLIDKTIVDSDGDSLIEIMSGYKCDLHLAATAPELLEALEVLVAHSPNKESEKVFLNLIAKAKGE